MGLDGHMLHPELAAGVPGTDYAHSLQAENVNLEEAAGCQLLLPGLGPLPLHFAWFYQSSSFLNFDDSYCNTIDIVAYSNYSSDDILRQGYLALAIIMKHCSPQHCEKQVSLSCRNSERLI